MIILLIFSAVVSYTVGSVNGAIILSRLFYGEDIREKGSKNPGFTNFKRVYGNGIVSWSVILIDVSKTALPVFLSAVLFERNFGMWQLGAAYSGLFCMLGHCFPIWYKLKGGKAFMAGFATTWFVDWRMATLAMLIFFVILGLFRYMSVASCTAALSCPIILFFLGPASFWVEILCALSALLIIARHYPNYIKLKNGTESKFSLKSNDHKMA